MPLRAKVVSSTGKCRHAVGKLVGGVPTPVHEIPIPEWVEIAEAEGAFYLFRLDANGVCTADTWHPTLDEAKRQATFEYGIHPDEWIDVKST